MEIGMVEAIGGAGVGLVSAILTGIWRSQKQFLDVITSMSDREAAPSDKSGNGVNHTKTHLHLQSMNTKLDDHSGTLRQIRDGIIDLNANLRDRPCIHD